MSLDMANGFWAIRMTARAKLISAFVCPFEHFQWVRMPFGLKNAPLVCGVLCDYRQNRRPRWIKTFWIF